MGPLFRVPSVFIPGFVSHHDTYFSLKQNRLFVTIVSPLLSFTAKHNRFKRGKIKASLWIEKINKIKDYLFFSSVMITLSVPGRSFVSYKVNFSGIWALFPIDAYIQCSFLEYTTMI